MATIFKATQDNKKAQSCIWECLTQLYKELANILI